MAGTLTAAVSTTREAAAGLSGGSELTVTASAVQTRTVNTLSSEGHLDVASVQIQAVAAPQLAGGGVLATPVKPIYVKTFTPSGAGTLSATAVNPFTPFNVTTNQTNAAVPAAVGCWLTLVGSGGNGGSGYSSSSAVVKGGGGGGGGGGKVNRSFISRAQMGSTYSCTKAASAGASCLFSSGGKQVSINGGAAGTPGGNNSGGAGGAGGAVTITGLTGLSFTQGGAGGTGGNSSNVDGNVGDPHGGGGGGGAGPTLSGTNAGSAGSSPGGAGGLGRATSTGNTGTAGSTPGGGGGGGGGGNPGGGGGNGAAGSLLIEWV